MTTEESIESIERIKKIVKEADMITLKALIIPTFLLFLNIFMVVYYEYQERDLFHVILQTTHLVGIVGLIYVFTICIRGNLGVKKQARESLAEIKKAIEENEQKV